MAALNSGHGMKRIFRKISYCFVFLSRINGTLQVRQHAQQSVAQTNGTTKHTSNFRVASLCFLFLRRLHAFEGRVNHVSSSFHTKRSRKRKSIPSAPKCTCCNIKTGSANSEEQTKTILTHTLRELVPKLSRICIGLNPNSSSQIWTADKQPHEWPEDIKWKDPNNNPKDSLDILQQKMAALLSMCREKNIPVEYQREIRAYQSVCDDLKANDTPDISKLQILRQQRKKSHELALACRHFSEIVKWHGAPERSSFLEHELCNLRLELQKANADRMLNAQFEEVYCAITHAEGSEKSPYDFMAQFNGTRASYDHLPCQMINQSQSSMYDSHIRKNSSSPIGDLQLTMKDSMDMDFDVMPQTEQKLPRQDIERKAPKRIRYNEYQDFTNGFM